MNFKLLETTQTHAMATKILRDSRSSDGLTAEGMCTSRLFSPQQGATETKHGETFCRRRNGNCPRASPLKRGGASPRAAPCRRIHVNNLRYDHTNISNVLPDVRPTTGLGCAWTNQRLGSPIPPPRPASFLLRQNLR